tara:strand:+ start:284 stop:955 length:672 start_codon:yes stop_codon:yes gene_type:complete
MADLLTNTGQASIAYQDALNQARNAQNALFAQYGYTMPNASGGYDSKSAGEAFDPNSLYDKSTGKVDETKLTEMFGQMQMGGTGLMADITRGGASAESGAVEELQSRGFGGDIGGGLIGQRRQLAESQTKGQIGSAKNQFVAGIGQAQAPIGGAWQTLQTGMAMDTANTAANQAAINTTSSSVVTPTNPTGPPTDKGTGAYQLKKGSDGVMYRWMGKKWKAVK